MSGGGVLQHLMAEQSYCRAHGNKNNGNALNHEAPNGTSPARGGGNSPLTKTKQQVPQYAKTPPRRALSDESPVIELPQAHPFLNPSSRSAESVSPHISNINYPSPHPPAPRTALPSASGLISRLRKEFSNKPVVPSQLPVNKLGSNELTSEISKNEDGHQILTPASTSFVRANFPSPASSKQQLYGHPKSNSAGEEFLYTDRKAKLAANKAGRRRGKNAASIMRSRSLHYADEATTQHVFQRRATTDLGLGPDSFQVIGAPRKRSDASTLSSSSLASDKPGSLSHSSSAGDNNYFQISLNEDNRKKDISQLNVSNSNLGEIGNIINTQQQQYPQSHHNVPHLSSMVLTPSGMGGLPQQTMTQGNNPHGPYYATVPTNPIGHHQMSQRHSPPPHPQVPSQMAKITQAAGQPRGPPPPYPQGSVDDTHQPQRPNSLSLTGQVSRKKMEYGGSQKGTVGGLTSPAISTNAHMTNFSSYPMSAGTPIHGTPFFGFTHEMSIPTATTSTTNSGNNAALQVYSEAPQQHHQPQFKRSGSANGYVAAPPQHADIQAFAGNGTVNTNVIGTPVSIQQQTQPPVRYEAARRDVMASSQIHHQHSNMTPQKQQQSTSPTGTGKSSGYSIGKSDSVNSNASTSSGGSRIARRAKRNSKNFSNTSGSSSSTGNSRPNSSADCLERIMSENDSLRLQLQTATQKLIKFQTVEKDLLRVTEEYEALRTSVAKSEKMEDALRNQLEATIKQTNQENEILRERIATLTELVETLQSTNKDAQSASSSDIMMYKVIVQDLQTQERILKEQLDESKDRILEQQEDISLLSSSLERMQANVSSLKEKLSEKQKVDQYVEELSPLLEMLSTTVQARIQAESELDDSIVQTQSSPTSEITNGMDSDENAPGSHSHSQSCTSPSSTSTLTREEQTIKTQAQIMLKWQHMYLQAALLRKLSPPSETTSNGNLSFGTAPLYSVLYRHRHAASDPSYNKDVLLDLPPGLKTLFGRDIAPRRDHKRDGESKRKQQKSRERSSAETQQHRSSPRRRRRETAPTYSAENEFCSPDNDVPKSAHRNAEMAENSDEASNNTESSRRHSDNTDLNNPETSVNNEFDSPSEGYHSQQSSGSPTPSSERSSVHFPDGDPRVTAALTQSDIPTSSSTTTTTKQQPDPTTSKQSATNTELFLLGSGNGSGKTVKVVDV
uniref:uncharacterized protein LOC120327689 isoform X1 n=1 Tax=Styela clava TaxID=7725 RepID=UPI00193ADB2A|nr:uncharacterized protein LOC120327689 isoform X1 [Styela clava]